MSVRAEPEGSNLLVFCVSKPAGRIELDAKNVPTRNSLGRRTFGCIEERRMPVPATHVHEAISPGSLVVAVQRREALAESQHNLFEKGLVMWILRREG